MATGGKNTIAINGQLVRKLRDEQGLTVKELAKGAKCSISAIEGIERVDRKNVLRCTLRNVAKALGKKPEELRVEQSQLAESEKRDDWPCAIFTVDTTFANFDLEEWMARLQEDSGGDDDMEPIDTNEGSVLITVRMSRKNVERVVAAFLDGKLRGIKVNNIAVLEADNATTRGNNSVSADSNEVDQHKMISGVASTVLRFVVREGLSPEAVINTLFGKLGKSINTSDVIRTEIIEDVGRGATIKLTLTPEAAEIATSIHQSGELEDTGVISLIKAPTRTLPGAIALLLMNAKSSTMSRDYPAIWLIPTLSDQALSSQKNTKDNRFNVLFHFSQCLEGDYQHICILVFLDILQSILGDEPIIPIGLADYGAIATVQLSENQLRNLIETLPRLGKLFSDGSQQWIYNNLASLTSDQYSHLCWGVSEYTTLGEEDIAYIKSYLGLFNDAYFDVGFFTAEEIQLVKNGEIGKSLASKIVESIIEICQAIELVTRCITHVTIPQNAPFVAAAIRGQTISLSDESGPRTQAHQHG